MVRKVSIALKPLRKVLKEVRQWRPGIKLWELNPEGIVFSSFRERQDADVVAHWDIDDLSETVEEDYAKMSKEEREEFDKLGYMWGYTKEGLVSITVVRPGEGMLVQFIESRGAALRKMR
jgi:hypothetical protein